MNKKICTGCKKEKSLVEFHKNKNRKDGYQHQCKKCKANLAKKYYISNKKLIDKKNKIKRIYVGKVVRRYKAIKGCYSCGTKDHWKLCFHHTKDKEHEISDLIRHTRSLRLVAKEITKCIILCHNCHADLHHKEQL